VAVLNTLTLFFLGVRPFLEGVPIYQHVSAVTYFESRASRKYSPPRRASCTVLGGHRFGCWVGLLQSTYLDFLVVFVRVKIVDYSVGGFLSILVISDFCIVYVWLLMRSRVVMCRVRSVEGSSSSGGSGVGAWGRVL
jgi:hypothetical protein